MEIVIQLSLTIAYCNVVWNLFTGIIRSMILFLVCTFSIQILISLFDFNENSFFSISTYILFNINIVCFIIGCCLVRRKTIFKIRPNHIICFNHVKNINIVMFVHLFFVFILVYYYYRMLSLLSIAAIDEKARSIFWETGGLFRTYKERFFYLYVVMNYKYIASFYFAILFIKKDKTKKEYVLFALATFFLLLIVLIGQGRIDLLILGVYLLVIIMIVKKINFVLFQYARKKVVLLFVVILAFISMVSMLRFGLNVNIETFQEEFRWAVLSPFIDYFAFPVTSFEYAKNIIFADVGFFYGGATFAGLQELIISPIIFFDTSISQYLFNDQLGELMSEFHTINGVYWNALYSTILNYYIDFGFFGCVFFPMLFGGTYAYLLKCLNKNFTQFDLLFILFLSFSYFRMLFCCPFQSMEFWTALLLIWSFKYLIMNEIRFVFRL